MLDNSINFILENEYFYVQYTGRITYTLTDEIGDFLDLRDGDTDPLKGVILDLSDATYLDSTNLGLMVKLMSFAKAHKAPKPVVVTKSEYILQSLRDIGIATLFEYLDELPIERPNVENNTTEIVCILNRNPQRNRVVEMHELLARYTDVFDDVIAMFKQDPSLECTTKGKV